MVEVNGITIPIGGTTGILLKACSVRLIAGVSFVNDIFL